MIGERFCSSCGKHRSAAGFVTPPGTTRERCEYCNPDRIVGYDKGRPITKREQEEKRHASARRYSGSLQRRGMLGDKLERVFKGYA